MSDAVASLQALWTASEEVTQKGLFSPEFRQWHASVLGILRQQFQPNDSIIVEFQQLEFELPVERLEALYDMLAASAASPEKIIESSFEDAPPELKEKMRQAMLQSQDNVSQENRRRLSEAAEGLQSSKHQFLRGLQEQHFRKAMGKTNELLAMAITELRNRG